MSRDGEINLIGCNLGEDVYGIFDPNPDPLEAAIQAEEAALLAAPLKGPQRPYSGPLVNPVHLLGLRKTWPLHETADGRCPGCCSRELAPTECCLHCHRSGIDHLLPSVPPAARPTRYRPGKLRGGKSA